MWTEIFAPNGTILKEGEIIRRENYSRTLAAIAEGGADVFYRVSTTVSRPSAASHILVYIVIFRERLPIILSPLSAPGAGL